MKNDVIFDMKADAVPFNYRISYRVSLICMIIGKCCGRKGCSVIKIQMISDAISTQTGRTELLALVNGALLVGYTLIRFDPAVSRAINYALEDGLICRQGNGLLRLSDRGKDLISNIYLDDRLMMLEKKYFEELLGKLTEDIIDKIAHNWRLDNA